MQVAEPRQGVGGRGVTDQNWEGPAREGRLADRAVLKNSRVRAKMYKVVFKEAMR